MIPAELIGFQWTLKLDGLDFISMESEMLSSDHVGIHAGSVTMSYARIDRGTEDVKVKLVVEATRSGKVSEMLELTSDITDTEGYRPQGGDIEIVDLALDFGSSADAEEYALYQNEVVREIEGEYAAGYTRVEVSSKDLLSGGVYYYTLKAGEFTASKKMIIQQ